MPEPVAPVVPPATPPATPPAVPPVAAPAVPPVATPPAVEYKFDAVEGYPESETKRVTEYAKEMGLDPEAAKKLHAADVKAWKADLVAIEQENAQRRTAWQTKNKGDTEFGGPKFDQTQAEIGKVFARFDTDGALSRDLETFGLKDQPNFFRVFARIATAMSEGKFVQAPTTKAEKPLHERLYPSAT